MIWGREVCDRCVEYIGCFRGALPACLLAGLCLEVGTGRQAGKQTKAHPKTEIKLGMRSKGTHQPSFLTSLKMVCRPCDYADMEHRHRYKCRKETENAENI